MLFPRPRRLGAHLLNLLGAIGVGLLFAYVGLNAAVGCGQGGQCIRLDDLLAADAPAPIAGPQLAERLPLPSRRQP